MISKLFHKKLNHCHSSAILTKWTKVSVTRQLESHFELTETDTESSRLNIWPESWLETRLNFTLQPVPEEVEPHAGKLAVVLLQHVANGVEPLVELVQERLALGVLSPLSHHVHVVEWEELELSADEVVLAGLSGHYVRQLQAVTHLGGPIETDSQQAQE